MGKNLKPSGSFNDSAREINKDAARDFALKIKLEGDLNKKLSQYFYKVDKNLTNSYSETGNILPANIFKDELKNILANHYTTVAKHFSSKLRMKAKSYSEYQYKALFCENKAVDHDISSQLSSYINKHSQQQSVFISNTNQKDFAQVVDNVKKDAAINAVLLSNSQIAKHASILFKARYMPRIDLISITETQNIAEKSKLIEAESLNSVVRSNAKHFTKESNPKQITKQWVTVLDERTRATHVAADSQVQFLRVPFVVGGEKMMSPGDSSLGASLGNIINCRCSANYIMPDSPDAPYVDEFTQVNANAPDLIADWTDDNGNEWGFVRGYATTFNQTNAQGITFSKQEFDYAVQLLKEQGTDYLPMYLNHDSSRLIGWYKVDDLISTRNGLYAEGYINLSTEAGREASQLVRLGMYRYYSVRGVRDVELGTFKLQEISIVDVPGMDEAVLMPVDVTRRSNIVRNPRNTPTPQVRPEDVNPDIGNLGRIIGDGEEDFADWFED